MFENATRVDVVVFVAGSLMCLVGALGVVLHKNPVHSALFLVLTLFGVAVHFVAQSAHFLAAVQVIVYAGAVVVLFLFVIMLIGIDKADKLGADIKGFRMILSIVIPIAAGVQIWMLGKTAWITGAPARPEFGADHNVRELGRSVFNRYLLPFELTSILLIVSVIGAVVLARRYELPLLSRTETRDNPGGGQSGDQQSLVTTDGASV